MKVIIAEKPSLARNIANGIGEFKRRDGYLENKEYLEQIYKKGAENARKLASKTLEDVKNKIGIL